MFSAEKVKSLNDLEMVAYNYLLTHLEKVQNMTIRELSDACHVSTSTILRGCGKLGLEGFSELKYIIRQELATKQNSSEIFYDANVQVDNFLKKVNNTTYRQTLSTALDMITNSEHILFSGIGTSGILGEYGCRYFMNLGMNAYSISDPFAPIPSRGLNSTLAIILSVSGETREMIERIESFKQYGAKVMSITNAENSTVARLSDFNLSYYMPEVTKKENQALNLTTQVPVITLIEILAQKAAEKLDKESMIEN